MLQCEIYKIESFFANFSRQIRVLGLQLHEAWALFHHVGNKAIHHSKVGVHQQCVDVVVVVGLSGVLGYGHDHSLGPQHHLRHRILVGSDLGPDGTCIITLLGWVWI